MCAAGDLVPDIFLGLGQLDDLGVLVLACERHQHLPATGRAKAPGRDGRSRGILPDVKDERPALRQGATGGWSREPCRQVPPVTSRVRRGRRIRGHRDHSRGSRPATPGIVLACAYCTAVSAGACAVLA